MKTDKEELRKELTPEEREEINVKEIAEVLTEQGVLLTDFISYSAYSAVERSMYKYAKSKLEAKDKEIGVNKALIEKQGINGAEIFRLEKQITDLKAEIERLKK